jgi:hypothetical protein
MLSILIEFNYRKRRLPASLCLTSIRGVAISKAPESEKLINHSARGGGRGGVQGPAGDRDI